MEEIIKCPICKTTELLHINFIIYSVVEKITSPFEDDSSLIVNYFSSEDKQMEFFKKSPRKKKKKVLEFFLKNGRVVRR